MNTNELATDALKAGDRTNVPGIHGNPASHPIVGMSQNWHRNLSPDNAVNVIVDADTVAEGVARVAEATLAAWAAWDKNPLENPIDAVTDAGIARLYVDVAARFGVGAAGEKLAAEFLEGRGETVEPPKDGDEDRGIDIRTNARMYQVKTGDRKRGWDAKDTDRVLWVDTSGDSWNVTDLGG